MGAMGGGSEASTFAYISSAFFVCILWALHAVFSCYVYIRLYSRILFNITIRFLSRIRSGRASSLNSLVVVRDQLSKLPDHIAFLLLLDSNQQEQLPWSEVANLVIWSIILGIHTVSLYDLHGCLKNNQELLLEEIHRIRNELVLEGCHRDLLDFRLCWRSNISHEEEGEMVVVVGGIGGKIMYPDVNDNNRESGGGGAMISWPSQQEPASSAPLVHISLLAPEDGKPDIARCARLLSREVRAGQVKSSSISESMISTRLCANRALTDPSLLVRIGLAQSNAHFLPWQVRLTEIHSLESLRGLRQQHLLDILRRFSGCEQRFGK